MAIDEQKYDSHGEEENGTDNVEYRLSSTYQGMKRRNIVPNYSNEVEMLLLGTIGSTAYFDSFFHVYEVQLS